MESRAARGHVLHLRILRWLHHSCPLTLDKFLNPVLRLCYRRLFGRSNAIMPNKPSWCGYYYYHHNLFAKLIIVCERNATASICDELQRQLGS